MTLEMMVQRTLLEFELPAKLKQVRADLNSDIERSGSSREHLKVGIVQEPQAGIPVTVHFVMNDL